MVEWGAWKTKWSGDTGGVGNETAESEARRRGVLPRGEPDRGEAVPHRRGGEGDSARHDPRRSGVFGGGTVHVRDDVEPFSPVGADSEKKGSVRARIAAPDGGALRHGEVPRGAGQVGKVGEEGTGEPRRGGKGAVARPDVRPFPVLQDVQGGVHAGLQPPAREHGDDLGGAVQEHSRGGVVQGAGDGVGLRPSQPGPRGHGRRSEGGEVDGAGRGMRGRRAGARRAAEHGVPRLPCGGCDVGGGPGGVRACRRGPDSRRAARGRGARGGAGVGFAGSGPRARTGRGRDGGALGGERFLRRVSARLPVRARRKPEGFFDRCGFLGLGNAAGVREAS